MDNQLKNFTLFGFVFAVIIVILFWLYQINKSSPIELSQIAQNNNAQSQQTTPGQLPASQPRGNAITQLPEVPPVPGSKIDAPDVLEKYGKYAFESFDKNPDLVKKIRAIYPAFKTEMMYVSFPSQVYKLNNGKDYLALGGCTEHNCGGTGVIVLYNLTDDKIYVGKEGKTQVGFEKYFGIPNDDEKAAMLNYYFQK